GPHVAGRRPPRARSPPMPRGALTTLAALAVFSIAVTRAADNKEAAVKKDWQVLEGTWELASVVRDGKPEPLPEGGKIRVTLKDGKYTVKVNDRVVDEGTGVIDPTKQPKTLDITTAVGPDKGKVVPGIYEIKGDEHRVCVAEPGKERPKEFAAKEGS